jgi:RNA polymerase sigma factor (sigma-70 family)
MGNRSLHPVLHYLRRLGPRPAPECESDDGQLLGRFLGHRDQAAFTAIVRRHGAMVWGVCARRLGETPDAEDAFQATFLVLVRKAPALRGPGSLGPWLYGVANRTALKAEGRNARRMAREKTLPNCAAGELGGEAGPEHPWGELRPVLDEELGRLPEKYRRPLVLCYLQGLSNEDAARVLGCPKGTVFSRLSRARDLLRRRLARRGVGVSGAALVTVLTANAATKAAPEALIAVTAGGLIFKAGTAGFAVPPHLEDLVEGVLRSMSLNKVKMVLGVLLALGIAGSGVGWITHLAQAGAGAPQQAARNEAEGKPAPVVPAAAPVRPPVDNAKPAAPEPLIKEEQAARLRKWRDGLTKPIKFCEIDDGDTKISDALDYLTRAYGFTYAVNYKAFQAGGVDIRNCVLGHPLPAMPVTTLASVLRAVLAPIPATSGALYVLRPDHVEITTAAALRSELGLQGQRPLLPLVWDVFENTPLNQAFGRVAEFSGYNVAIDPRVADKVKMSVDTRLNNVPADTAVRLLANMAGLGVARLDNVFYVTTRENAAVIQADEERLNADKPTAPQRPRSAVKNKP